MEDKIKTILREMEKYLSATEMQILQKSLIANLLGREKEERIITNEDYLKNVGTELFIQIITKNDKNWTICPIFFGQIVQNFCLFLCYSHCTNLK